MPQRAWFEREFKLGTPVAAQPKLLERLRGTPARLEEGVSGLPQEVLAQRSGDSWSIAEHAGHLSDLEPLWLGRVDDITDGRSHLRSADLENKATWAANHNARPLDEILSEFRERRGRLIRRLEELGERDLRATALHPRLDQPMTIVDLCFFVAEHDDHHLATIATIRGAAV